MEVITGPNQKTKIADNKYYVLVHTFWDGSQNHPEEGVENLQEIIEKGGYTGKCPFIGCESVIQPEDIQGVLSDEFYATFKDKMASKTGARRRTYRRRGANILPKGL